MIIDFKSIFKGKPEEEKNDQAQRQASENQKPAEDELREKAPEFMAAIDEIRDIDSSIRTKTAALEALFIRRFHKFNTVNDYLDMLKNGKFADVYDAAGVDLKTNSILSIDSFCRKVITDDDEWQKEYRALDLKEVVFDMNNNPEAEKAEPEKAQEETDEATAVNFDNIILKEDNGNEEEIQFRTDEAENAGKEGPGSGKKTGKKSQQAASGRKTDKRNDTGSSGDSEAGSTGTGSGTDVQRAEEDGTGSGAGSSDDLKDVNRVANTIKKFVKKGSEITVEKTIYADGRNVGTYDVTITDETGMRAYVLDQGSIIPDKLSIIVTTANNMMMVVPIVKRERELVSKIFSAPYIMSEEEFTRICDSGLLLPDMTLYNNIDMTGASFLYNLTSTQKKLLAKNLKFAIASIQSQGRSLRFRIQKFKSPEDFVLASDSKCVSPTPGLFTSSDIGFIKLIYKKDQDLKIQKSDDRIEEEEKAEKATANSTITSQQPEFEIKDHRQTA